MLDWLQDGLNLFWLFVVLILGALTYGVFNFFFSGGSWPSARERKRNSSNDQKPGQAPRSQQNIQGEVQARSSGYPDQGGPQ